MSSRRAVPTFELRLLGGATLLAADGTRLGGPVAHRRRLALLALLALAHPAGIRRDKLVGLLWPERDEPAARNLLRVALHELRRNLGGEALFAAGDELRIEPRLIRCDVRAFESALDAGDPGAAVARYGGPFLDGLFIEEAEELGRWMDGERLRLATRYADALQRLAESATAAGDAAGAAGWWRRLALDRPSDGGVALQVVESLAAAGDLGGALDHAEAHASYLAAEYGVAVDPALGARVAALRQRSAAPLGAELETAAQAPAATPDTEPVAAAVEASSPTPGLTPGAMPGAMPGAAPVALPGELAGAPQAAEPAAVPSAPLATTAPAGAPRRAAPERPRRGWRRWAAAAGLVAAAAAAAALALPRTARRGPPAGAPASVAVLPFTVVAGAPAELGEGLPTLLAVNLDQVGELRVVPAQVVLAHVAGPAEEPARLARDLRADAVLTGVVAPSREGVAVRAALVAADGAELARAEARGAVDDLTALVDQLSVGVLREIWGRRWGVPTPRLAAVGTASPAALRAYVRGEAFLRAAQWDSAVPTLAEAVDRDSTFALARLRLAEAHGWRSGMGAPADARELAAAAALADRLPPRERRLLAVRRLHEAAELAAADSAAELAERYPDDPEAQYVRADVRFHARSVSGDSVARLAVAAFDTAAALDAASPRVWTHAVALAFERGDRVRFDRAVAHLTEDAGGAADRATPSWRPDYALQRRIRWGSPAEAHRAFVDALRGPTPPAPVELEELVQALEMACLGAPTPAPDLLLDGLARLRARYPESTRPRVLSGVDGRRALLLVGLGRLRAARPLVDALWARDPDDAALLVALPVALGYAGRPWIEANLPGLERSAFWSRTPAMRRRGEYWRGVLALQRGDVAGARAAFARAAPPPGEARTEQAHGMVGVLRGAEGWARLVEGDTTAAMRLLADGIRAGGYTDVGVQLGRVQRVVHEQLLAARPERRAEALDWLRAELTLRPGYAWAWRRRDLAALLAAGGDAVGAAAARARFAALWAGADATP